MKTLVILVLLAQTASSCITPKSLTKHEAISREFLARLEPGKKYLFELKIGAKQVVKIKQVKDDLFIGQVYEKDNDGKKVWNDFSDTFENIEKNVDKISVYKVNPALTIPCVTAASLFIALWVFWYPDAW